MSSTALLLFISSFIRLSDPTSVQGPIHDECFDLWYSTCVFKPIETMMLNTFNACEVSSRGAHVAKSTAHHVAYIIEVTRHEQNARCYID